MAKKLFLALFFLVSAMVLVSCDDVNPTELEVLVQTAESMEIELEVTDNFELPVTFENEGITVSWTSDNAAIFIVSGNQAVVTRSSEDVSVKLTAVFTLGEAVHEVDVNIVVKAVESVGSVTVEFTVTLPVGTPLDDEIVIAGNFGSGSNMPEWAPGDPVGVARRIDATTASFTLVYDNVTDPITIQYKWTRGSWETVEKDINGDEVGDRTEVITADFETVTIDNVVERWADFNPDLTDEEKLVLAKDALTVPSDVLADFVLPLSFDHGSTISWASSNSAIAINGSDAVVTSLESDIRVILTATISIGSLMDTKDFEVTVKSSDTTEFDTFELTINVDLPSNTPMEDDIFIFGNFPENTGLDVWGGADNPLNKLTRDGNRASITINFTELTDNITLEYKITRGNWDKVEGNETAGQSANREYVITRLLETHEIEITVLTWEDLGVPAQTDEEKIEQALQALVIQPEAIENFTLPLSGLNETTISWASNDAAITIDGANATLNRGETDITVELTATITLGELSDTHVFEVVVKALGVVYFETFDLTLTVLLPEYTPLEAEIFVFGNFPANTGLTAWGSGDNTPNKLSRDGNTATITINFTELSDTFNLEYKITRGTWDNEEVTLLGGNVSNRQFEINRLFESSDIEVTVDRWKDITPPLTDEQKLDQAMDNLTILENVSEDFTLPLLGLHNAVITWISDNPVIAIDGENATITEDDIEILVILTATITVNGISDIKAFEVSVSSVSQVVYENVTVVMNVTLPVNTPVDATISVGGSFGALSGIPNWNPESPLGVATKDGYSATFIIQYNGLQSNQSIDYKWTRGSWATVEKGATGEELNNRSIVIDRLTEVITVNDVVLNWADLSVDETPPSVVGNLTIIEDFAMPGYGEDIFRTIRIWTPGNYDPEGVTTYPVIYMQDGQNLFDAKTSFAGEWEIDETITGLMDMSLFAGAIVVGIDNSGANRLNEYTPNWSDTPEAGGALYAAFIVDTLKPYIDENYLTKPEREHTMVAGSSMGGLISFYIGLEYPEIFGMVGAFSTSFQMNTDVARQAFIDALDTENLPPRIILDAGSEESLETFVPIVVEELADAGYPMIHVFSEVVAGHGHNEAAWRERFGDALVWLFSNEPGNYALVIE